MADKCPYCKGTGLLQGDFSSRLLKARQDKGVTQEDVASAVRISRAQIANLERGRGDPSVDVVIRAAQYFGCSADYLLAIDTPTHPNVNRGCDNDANS